MILYSFVLPAYKADFLDAAINSILSQTYTNFELIIVDDDSPFDLTRIVDKYRHDARLSYYRNHKNIGGTDLVAQWNHCLGFAKGEYVILASDDDLYDNTYLESINELIKKYPNVNVFRPRVQEIDECDNIRRCDAQQKEYMSQIEFVHKWLRCEITRYIPEYVFKTKSLIELGGFVNFPLAWFSDDATVIEMASQGLVCCADVLFSFRNSGVNISSRKDDIQNLNRKLIATGDFYRWLPIQVLGMSAVTSEEKLWKEQILQQYIYRKIDHMVWLICESSVGLAQACRVLMSLKTLSFAEYIRIVYRVLKSRW